MSGAADNLYKQTLVLRSQLGDEAAFRELLRIYSPRVLAFTRKMLADAPDRADDVAQETWIAIFRGLPALLDVTKFKPWAFRVARDRVYRELRRRRLRVEPLDDAAIEDFPGVDAPEPLIDRQDLESCLASISPEHREVLVLRYFEEMDYEEISRAINSTLGTVRSRLHYAKRALRRAVDQKLYELRPE